MAAASVESKGSESMVLDLGSPCTALAASPDRSLLAVGGKEVKIISTAGGRFRVTKTVRMDVRTTDARVTDIAWNPAEAHKEWLVSALTNGHVILWNLNRDPAKHRENTLENHERAVNRVCWHPNDWWAVFSGSQDGTVRLWDVRKKHAGSVFKDTVSVRDVHVCPQNQNQFAAAYENGTVQVWDMRNTASSVSTILAHQGLVLSIDWHPEERDILASASLDRSIKAWDVRDGQKPLYNVQTIASVGFVRWRPGRTHQVASTSSIIDFDVYLWDVKRPYIPLATLSGHKDTVMGFLWADNGDQLISCAKDGLLIKHSLTQAYFPYEHVNTTAIAWNVNGALASAFDCIHRSPTILERSHVPFGSGQTDPKHLHGPDKALVTIRNIANPVLSREAAVVHLAQHYWLRGRTLRTLCEHNAQVAAAVDQLELVQLWSMVKLLFAQDASPASTCGSVPSASPVKGQSLRGSPVREIEMQHGDAGRAYSSHRSSLSQADLGAGSGVASVLGALPVSLSLQTLPEMPGLSRQQTPASPDIEAEIRGAISESLPTLHPAHMAGGLGSGLALDSAARAFRESFVMDYLEHAGEQGDVQTCAVLCVVLRKHIQFPESRTRVWFAAYIDLLQRHQLFSIMAQIVKMCPDKELRAMNQKSTTIAVSCHCRAAAHQTGDMCKTCNKTMTQCSVCQQKVSGIYVWCQGCGHGGHIAHMEEWFAESTLCPTGCLHECVNSLTHEVR